MSKNSRIADDIQAAKMDRHNYSHPKLFRSHQMGLALVKAAVRDGGPLAEKIADSARGL
jgi:hypothetical protein